MPPVPEENKKFPNEDSLPQNCLPSTEVILVEETSSDEDSDHGNTQDNHADNNDQENSIYAGYQLLDDNAVNNLTTTVHQQFQWHEIEMDDQGHEEGEILDADHHLNSQTRNLPDEEYKINCDREHHEGGEQALESSSNVHWKDSDFPIKHAPRLDSVHLDEEKIEIIKSCMVGFTLPSSNVPKWAKNVSEEQWKEHLLKKIEEKNSDSVVRDNSY